MITHTLMTCETEGRRRRPLARVAHFPDVPVLPDPPAGETHQAHEPGERHDENEQGVLRAGRHLAPADLAARFDPRSIATSIAITPTIVARTAST